MHFFQSEIRAEERSRGTIAAVDLLRDDIYRRDGGEEQLLTALCELNMTEAVEDIDSDFVAGTVYWYKFVACICVVRMCSAMLLQLLLYYFRKHEKYGYCLMYLDLHLNETQSKYPIV